MENHEEIEAYVVPKYGEEYRTNRRIGVISEGTLLKVVQSGNEIVLSTITPPANLKVHRDLGSFNSDFIL